MPNNELQDFEAIKARLEEIVEAVSDEGIPLDDALDLYEEAVDLGMRVSDVLEDGIVVDEAALAGPAEADSAEADSAAADSANAGAAPADGPAATPEPESTVE